MTDSNTHIKKPNEKYLTFVFGLLLFSILGIPLVVTSWADEMADKWFLIRVLGPALLVLLLLFLSGKEIRRDPLPLLPVLAFALIGAQLFSLVGTTNIGISIAVISRQIGLLGFFLVVRYFAMQPRRCLGILQVIVILGAASSIYGIAQRFGYDFVDWQRNSEVPTERGASFVGHATFAASSLIITLPITVTLIIVAASRIQKALWSTVALIMLYHLSFTGARVATVALFLGTTLAIGLIIWNQRRMKDGVVNGLITRHNLVLAAVGVVLVGSIFVGRAWQEKGSDPLGLLEGGMAQRIFAWETANRMFLANPVNGVGVGNYEVASPPYWNRIEAIRYSRYLRALYQPHNEYFETAAETGLPGLIVLLGLLAVATTRCLSGIQAGSKLHYGLLAALFTTMLDSCFIFPWQIPDSALLFWLLLGVIDGAHPESETTTA